MRRIVAGLLGMLAVMACGSSEARPRALRLISASYLYEIQPDEAPPHARERVSFRIRVTDRKTHQLIENGEGRIFASDSLGRNTWDGFVYGPEVGTYHGVLSFVTSGPWALAIQFRRDTLHRVERIDWLQDVLNEKPSPTP
jgi:hypothetical protein